MQLPGKAWNDPRDASAKLAAIYFFGKIKKRFDIDSERWGRISRADASLRPLLNEFPDAIVEFRGSLARGTKRKHKKFADFDSSNFDVDAFIVSDELAARVPQDAKGFRNLGRLTKFEGLLKSISDSLREIPGHRNENVKI